ncbi:MAG: hypothetical protein K0R01_1480, partial [Mycobacterium sp.]|nr:hypothetical protein [Mycobacterium sp.]
TGAFTDAFFEIRSAAGITGGPAVVDSALPEVAVDG